MGLLLGGSDQALNGEEVALFQTHTNQSLLEFLTLVPQEKCSTGPGWAQPASPSIGANSAGQSPQESEGQVK